MDSKLNPEAATNEKSERPNTLIMVLSMFNEMSLVFCATTMGHSRFYIHSMILLLTIVIVGIPLVYSEICVAQYTNSDVLSTWGFCPFFRGFGYGTIFIMLLKLIHVTIMCSWYSVYSFETLKNPPPWFSCNFTNDTRCMVKKVDVPIFQHCVEAIKTMEDCEMYTASYLFFDAIIGSQNTLSNPLTCFVSWSILIPASMTHFCTFLILRKKITAIAVFVKLFLLVLVLLLATFAIVTLSTPGGWLSTREQFHWHYYKFIQCMQSVIPGFLMLGTGSGMLTFLSRKTPFRSNATNIAVMSSLLASLVAIILALVIYSGINSMSYFHGYEEAIIEMGNSHIFEPFASVAEIFSYFDSNAVWTVFWFVMIFLCLLAHLMMLCEFFYIFLAERIRFVRKYTDSSRFMICIVTLLLLPLFSCCDMLLALKDALDITQLLGSFSFSISLYWFYGFRRHSVDIAFMIGVKSSYYWKVLWFLNPIIIGLIIFAKVAEFRSRTYDETSYMIESLSIACSDLMMYILLALYCIVVLTGTVMELCAFYNSKKKLINILFADENWGPKDKVLFKSRAMFVSEIMTTEFLYRQVKLRGCEKNKNKDKENGGKRNSQFEEYTGTKMEWSALTSN